jgi:hypothetical protein
LYILIAKTFEIPLPGSGKLVSSLLSDVLAKLAWTSLSWRQSFPTTLSLHLLASTLLSSIG